MGYTPKVSIIVCTRNRSHLLIAGLESLLNQDADPKSYEVVVVDNNSTDKTADVVRQFKTDSKVRVTYVKEPTLGLSHARNRGVTQSSGAYLLFIDDDAKIESDYIATLLSSLAEAKPDIVGGPILPFYNTHKPKWFKDTYQMRSHGDEKKYLKQDEYLSGSNLCINRKIVGEVGGFDPNYGMIGSQRGYGEETLFQLAARKAKKTIKVLYDPDLVVYHLVSASKMSITYQLASHFQQGRSNHRLREDTQRFEVKGKLIIKAVIHIILMTLKMITILSRDRKKYPYLQQYVWEKVTPHIYWLGATVSIL